MTPAALLAELLPPGAPDRVTVDPDGIATAALGRDWLLAAWSDEAGRDELTVAAYTLPGGRCHHLWTGPADRRAPHDASEALRRPEGTGGLPVRHCSAPAPRSPPPAVDLTCSAGDALDLFSV